ncbi:4-nitrophenylphosphatase [Apis mellifera caucasica]|nr:4-nitrophenylphosphatase [Apis mellifera caucasica]
MAIPLDLREATTEQMQDFLNSFDIIFSDCDGVIWHLLNPIPGSILSLRKLQDLGKRLYLVSNNSNISIDEYIKRFKKYGLIVEPEQIIISVKVISSYLKKLKVSRKVVVLATLQFRESLKKDGFHTILPSFEINEQESLNTIKNIIHNQTCDDIDAVVLDFCNYDWGLIVFLLKCLNNESVHYITGCTDEYISYSCNEKIIGSGPFIDIISKYSKRSPIKCAKPSQVLKQYVFDTCNVQDPGRCLFIGDSIKTDMKFAHMCGFKKMFVDTGIETIKNTIKNEETCPHFYLPSLGMLYPIIDSLQKNISSKQNI